MFFLFKIRQLILFKYAWNNFFLVPCDFNLFISKIGSPDFHFTLDFFVWSYSKFNTDANKHYIYSIWRFITSNHIAGDDNNINEIIEASPIYFKCLQAYWNCMLFTEETKWIKVWTIPLDSYVFSGIGIHFSNLILVFTFLNLESLPIYFLFSEFLSIC